MSINVSSSWPFPVEKWRLPTALEFGIQSSVGSRHLHPATSVHSDTVHPTYSTLPDPDKSEESGRKKWLDLVSESCFEFLSRDSYWDARGMECFEMTERGNALKFIMSGTFVLPWYIGSISACMPILLSTSPALLEFLWFFSHYCSSHTLIKWYRVDI